MYTWHTLNGIKMICASNVCKIVISQWTACAIQDMHSRVKKWFSSWIFPGSNLRCDFFIAFSVYYVSSAVSGFVWTVFDARGKNNSLKVLHHQILLLLELQEILHRHLDVEQVRIAAPACSTWLGLNCQTWQLNNYQIYAYFQVNINNESFFNAP